MCVFVVPFSVFPWLCGRSLRCETSRNTPFLTVKPSLSAVCVFLQPGMAAALLAPPAPLRLAPRA